MYDSLDWRRQHCNYLENTKFINVPELSESKSTQPPATEARILFALQHFLWKIISYRIELSAFNSALKKISLDHHSTCNFLWMKLGFLSSAFKTSKLGEKKKKSKAKCHGCKNGLNNFWWHLYVPRKITVLAEVLCLVTDQLSKKDD